MLRQARFEFGLGERQGTLVQGMPGPESTVISDLCCVGPQGCVCNTLSVQPGSVALCD